MTDRATLEALLARVLEGEGPNRELDGDITRLLLPKDADAVMRSRYGWSYIIRGSGLGFEWLENKPYTASLDAALTLVPERWKVASLGESPERTNSWTVWLRHRRDETELLGVMVNHAATPARALVAACLKARMDVQGD